MSKRTREEDVDDSSATVNYIFIESDGEDTDFQPQRSTDKYVLRAALPAHLRTSVTTLLSNARTAHAALSTALTNLEHLNATLETPTSAANILSNLTATRAAGMSIFAPQAAYQSSIRSLRCFISETLAMLPDTNVTKIWVKFAFETLVESADELEETIGTELGGSMQKPAQRDKEGDEKSPAERYLQCVKQRFCNLKLEQEMLGYWSQELVGAFEAIEDTGKDNEKKDKKDAYGSGDGSEQDPILQSPA
ncbi:hypothetical protein K505DRAFT_360781 [Melanomma pulvis-pyrius CBS 109.77]|uniref:Uncharacterized protein n=1 Tax=Melanomma pulvis-pyrius CBS 109.77 TaxID=1314802 RepID=A0A6A6XF63_9PLEO|nr:hypothetical protein K505DRAFT_360781 [Melanomma pulvis-pyrius CBS 109.77]